MFNIAKKNQFDLMKKNEHEWSTKDGIILGADYKGRLLKYDGLENILLMAPTRSGKGVSMVMPNCLNWKHSLFILDHWGEAYNMTAGYRKEVLKQKVIKFDLLSTDGSSARWNPLAEINFRTNEELSDIQNIVGMIVDLMIVDPEGKGQLDYWANTGSALLIGTILHLMYMHYAEKKPLPTLSNVASFLSSPERSIDEQLELMKTYPHITVDEFLSAENIFQEIYGEYISNFQPYNEALTCEVHTLNELKEVIKENGHVNFDEEPFRILLTHPRVAEAAAEMINKAPNEQSGVLSTAKTFLNLYQNPVVAKNMSVSDFSIDDIVISGQGLSFYMIYNPISDYQPYYRLFINMLFNKLMKEVKVNNERLLLMLDNFTKLGKFNSLMDLVENDFRNAQVCLIARDTYAIEKLYGMIPISISCGIQIYYQPTVDDNESAKIIINKLMGMATYEDIYYGIEQDDAFIFINGHKPLLGKKIRYYQDPNFNKKMRLPVP